MATALVTGATSGIGLTFATHLAARGDDLVIVARDEQRLCTVADDLRQRYGVEVEILRADLGLRIDVDRVSARIEDAAEPIETVVNNAGFGLHSTVLDPADLDAHRLALDVMCFAVLVLSGAAGRAMRDRGHGAIINVASTAAWIPTGNYSAVKSWVVNYTEGLANELSGTGVHVTALCPGWVRTEFHERAGISSHKLPGVVWVDPDTLVRDCLTDSARGRILSIPTLKWKAAIAWAQVAPRGFARWFGRVLTNSRKRAR